MSRVRLALLGSGLLVNLISFSVYPYLAVLLRERLGLGMGEVGVVLGIATLIQFAGGLPGAALAERIGLQRALVLAMVAQTVASAGFLAGGTWPAITIAALLLRSAATALYSPAVRGYTLHGAGEAERARLVSWSYATGNIGIALGPAVGSFFIHDPGAMFAVAALLHAGMTVGHVLLPRDRPEPDTVVEPMRRALHGLAVLPFVVTALTLYLHMHFYQYLSSYAEGRVSTVFLGAAMTGYSLALALIQPVITTRVAAMAYPRAMGFGFGGLAIGMIAFAAGTQLAIGAGIVAIAAGNAVLFLKNTLMALDGARRSPAVVFGQQRLAEGLGACASGLAGGSLYQFFASGGHLSGFWLVIAAQCLVLPGLVMLASRRRQAVTV